MNRPRTERAIEACVRYEESADALRRTTRAIADALRECPLSKQGVADEAGGALTRSGMPQTHLHRAYNGVKADGYVARHLDEQEQEALLSNPADGCPHCLQAWHLVRERKALKQEFGAAKRAVRAIGSAEVKARREAQTSR